jgi:hypothetical protein
VGPVREDVITWRRHFHQNPEPSFQEEQTAQFVADTLESFPGIEVSRPTPTSVLGRLRGARPGHVLAIRADMDGLPIQEENDFEFASRRPGVMHACGHDAHTAMLLATAKVLSGLRQDLPGEVRFLFQHAEELFPGGADEMIGAGVMDGVDAVIGAHVWSPLEAGKIGIVYGPAMAGPDTFWIGDMFSAVQAAKPGFLALPATGLSASWFISTVLLTSFGFYMWPQFFGATFSAHNERVFRRNAIALPLYQLILLFIFFVGFAAILQVPGLKGASGDLSLLRLVKEAFPPWLVGVVGAAGVLTAMVPGSMLLMTSATVLANNVFSVFAPAATQRQVGNLARALVPVLAAIALLFTFRGGSAIVSLLLAGYSLVTQLFPALMASLPRRPVVPKEAAATGIIVGVLTVAYLTISGSTVATLFPGLPQWIKDLNVGIVALLVNLAAMAVVTVVMRALSPAGAGTSPAPVRTREPAEAGDSGRR